jgi:NADPH:quinone reductase-like Zn-dependent oxidoreductase
MNAWILDGGFGFDHLRRTQRPKPTPGPGEVCVRMEAWSLNYRDLLMLQGKYNPTLKFPLTPFSDGAGIVESVGPGVSGLATGQRVTSCFMPDWTEGTVSRKGLRSALGAEAPGVLAEWVLLPAHGVMPVAAHLSLIEAATLPCAGLTAWNALFESAEFHPGQTILTLGTGGVSLFAIAMAKKAGMRVIATTGTPEKSERLKEMGAEQVILYRDHPEWGAKAASLAGGEGIDLVVEVGGAGTIEQSLRAVRPGGTISLIGVLSQAGPAGPGSNLVPILMRHIRMQGILVGSRAMYEHMNVALSSWQMKPVIDKVFDFAEVPAALAYQASGKHMGKVCVKL